MLYFRLKKQTSKNIVDTTFKWNRMGAEENVGKKYSKYFNWLNTAFMDFCVFFLTCYTMLVERKSIMVDHEEKRLKTRCKVRLCYLWIANHFLKITSWNYSKFHRKLQSNFFWWLNFFPSKLLYMLRPLVNQTHK